MKEGVLKARKTSRTMKKKKKEKKKKKKTQTNHTGFQTGTFKSLCSPEKEHKFLTFSSLKRVINSDAITWN